MALAWQARCGTVPRFQGVWLKGGVGCWEELERDRGVLRLLHRRRLLPAGHVVIAARGRVKCPVLGLARGLLDVDVAVRGGVECQILGGRVCTRACVLDP